MADAEFVDPANGDYRVKDGSPALALGFVNFPMDQFGVQKPELKAIARVPQLPQPEMAAPASAARAAAPRDVARRQRAQHCRRRRDVRIRPARRDRGFGAEVPAESALAKAGLQKNDVILSVNGGKTLDTAALLRQAPALPAGSFLKIGVSRDQKEFVVQLVP